MSDRFRLTGLIAAPFTPFHVDGSLNPDAIDPMTKLLIESGVTGVFVCGSTGEGHSLSVAERTMSAERWMKAVHGRMPVLLHVGHNSLSEARTLAAHAASIGASAIAVVAPSYYKPKSVDDLIDFMAPVAAAAPALPLYYYNIPSMTGVSLPVPQILEKGKKRIPTLNGVKFSHSDLQELQECLALDGGAFDVVFGFDEMLLAGLALGCRGAVGCTYNFAAPLYNRMIAAFDKGDLITARREQLKSVELIRALYDFGLLPASKALMGMLGIDCGPVRAPLKAFTKVQTRALYERLKPMDIFARPLRLSEG